MTNQNPVPEPAILDAVPAPGGTCQLYHSREGGRPQRCDNDADWLFVYTGSVDPAIQTPKNALACHTCFTPPEHVREGSDAVGVDLATDGGQTSPSLRHRDVIRCKRDGEEVAVYNRINLTQPAMIRGLPTVERFETQIGAGDSQTPPEAITHWVAHVLTDEFGITRDGLATHDIAVVDPTAPEVTVL
ncbi:hypothetical protein AArcSl_1609 [Halalkaliarchaeum desulfuricum]|uniref:Uncharacterized protein n=1 Tax=Halalkaliarchaeum desulfuricum TaxID=2055893 RepID=A0A343TJG6_9EURY|nr:hypothetical protein [Halalkaliarchaeum desulfuricum]AUX09238.1 hypothetical protein AArcSl_1609 [Halalkaliarchaeum desulfuricum]